MEIVVKSEEKLIKFLIHNIQGLSFGSAQKMLRLGNVKVNGKRTKDNISLTKGDTVEVREFKKSMPRVEIIYEDGNILIVNKPQGIECASRDKSSDNTYSLEEIFESHNAIVIHRLDRLTEGLVILAKSKEMATKWERIFRMREVNKKYLAFVQGNFSDNGIKTAYLKKDCTSSKVTISNTEKEGYKEIITEFKLLKQHVDYSVVDVTLHTGRTHQIRAHLSHLGHPILNDSKYSPHSTPNPSNYAGYYLCAYSLSFSITDGELSYLNDLSFEITPTFASDCEI